MAPDQKDFDLPYVAIRISVTIIPDVSITFERLADNLISLYNNEVTRAPAEQT